jgi:hypothetical protein
VTDVYNNNSSSNHSNWDIRGFVIQVVSWARNISDALASASAIAPIGVPNACVFRTTPTPVAVLWDYLDAQHPPNSKPPNGNT